MCDVSSVPERLVPSCLEHFWQKRERVGRLYFEPKKIMAGGHAQWNPFLRVVWAIVYQVQDDFRLLEFAVVDVILLDGESLEVCSEVSMA